MSGILPSVDNICASLIAKEISLTQAIRWLQMHEKNELKIIKQE